MEFYYKLLFIIKYSFQTLQAFLPNMIEKNHGHVVAISSIAAFHPSKDGTVYCATKLGVKGISKPVINNSNPVHNDNDSIDLANLIYAI